MNHVSWLGAKWVDQWCGRLNEFPLDQPKSYRSIGELKPRETHHDRQPICDCDFVKPPAGEFTGSPSRQTHASSCCD